VPEPRWIELRLGSSADDDRILVRGVRPLLRGAHVDVAVKRGYFLRESKRLRLRFEIVDGSAAGLASWLGELLAGCGLNSVEIEADDAPQFAELEGLWEGASAGVLREDFFGETSAFVLDRIAELGGEGNARMRLGFDLMVAHAVAIDEILSGHLAFTQPRAFLTYRSHADGFFIMSKNPAAAKRTFDERLQGIRPALDIRLGAILSALSLANSSSMPAARYWRSTIAARFPQVLQLLCEGRLKLPIGEDAYLGDRYDISVSNFHQVIQDDAEHRRRMREDVEFHCIRVLLTCLYWTLQHIGLRLIERFFLCHATSLAFEQRFLADPVQLLQRPNSR
jgi:hypothetical protein